MSRLSCWQAALLFVAIAGNVYADGGAPSADEEEVGAFKDRAVPIIRKFVFANYERFRTSDLTMRHLKKHLSTELGLTLEQLKTEHLEEAIFDTTDEIANTCEMGEVRLKECQHRIGYVDEPTDKDET